MGMKDKYKSINILNEHSQSDASELESRPVEFPDGLVRFLHVPRRVWDWYAGFIETDPETAQSYLGRLIQTAQRTSKKRGVTLEEELSIGFAYTMKELNSRAWRASKRFF